MRLNELPDYLGFLEGSGNRRKHSVIFLEAAEALRDTLLETIGDDRHPAAERRFFSVGETKRRRLLTIGHTDEDDEIRIVLRVKRRDASGGTCES